MIQVWTGSHPKCYVLLHYCLYLINIIDATVCVYSVCMYACNERIEWLCVARMHGVAEICVIFLIKVKASVRHRYGFNVRVCVRAFVYLFGCVYGCTCMHELYMPVWVWIVDMKNKPNEMGPTFSNNKNSRTQNLSCFFSLFIRQFFNRILLVYKYFAKKKIGKNWICLWETTNKD